MRHCYVTLMTLLLSLCAVAAPAQAANHIRATLVTQSTVPRAGTAVTLAVVFTPDKGWHGYWQNPGDAGFGARFDWKLPAGITAGPPQYPVPQRLVIAGLMNHVYEQEYALLVQIKLPRGLAAGTKLPIRARVDWLACTDKICVPENGDISVELTVGNGAITPDSQARFDGWWAKLPRPLGSEAKFHADDGALHIGIPFPASAEAKDPWFYAITENAVNYAAPQKVSRRGDMLIIETTAAGNPETLEGVLAIGPDKGLAVKAVDGIFAWGGEAAAETLPSGGLATILLALGCAILGGLILNIMPCVFPIISLKAMSLARAGGNETAAKREALAYAAGVILTCLALGGIILGLRASGTQIGWAFQLQEPGIVFLLLLLATAITLNLLGVFHLRGFGGGEALAGKGGTAGAFWTGALAAFVATPCTGPFMAAALGAALVLPTAAALAIFAGLGLGLALPFLAIGFVPALRKRMPRPGAWMVTFQRLLAIPMALTVVALAWLLWRQVGPHPVALPGTETAAKADHGFSESKLAALRASGKPVFLYFTADWCLTCKVNEKAAIERAEVEAAFRKAGVIVMVGDWTNGDPAITRFLNAHGASGVPLYLFYPKGGGEPEQLPQVLTPGLLAGLAG